MNRLRKHLQGPMTNDEYKTVRADLIAYSVALLVMVIIAGVHSWLH